MNTYQDGDTISLWTDNSQRSVTLKNLQTGKRFSYVLKNSFIVGRVKEFSDLQITTDDKYISGKHVRFINENGDVYIEDLHSKNGTKLNGKRISSITRIKSGDILRVGRSEFEIII